MSDAQPPMQPDAILTEDGLEQEVTATLAGAAGLDQVREILFGQHSRTLEQRVVRIEERLDRAFNEITTETASRLDTLESYIKNELTMLIDKLGAQREERSTLFQQLRGEIETTTKKLDKKLNEVSERVGKLQADLRADLLRQVNSMSEEIETRSETISHELATETAQLRNDLVDRASMCSLLSELAMKLTDQPLPSAEHAEAAGEALDELLGGGSANPG